MNNSDVNNLFKINKIEKPEAQSIKLEGMMSELPWPLLAGHN